MTEPVKIYISYSHKDDGMKNQLITYLTPLQREGLVSIWNDKDLFPGADWHSELSLHLEEASIILLLVSQNYLASRWCYEFELSRAMERSSSGEAIVIPILLRKCEWHPTPIGRLSVVPSNNKPITEWRNRPDAYLNVVESIRHSVYQFQQFTHRTDGVTEDKTQKLGTSQVEGVGKVTTITKPGATLIIHGHAGNDRNELRHFLQNNLGLPKPIVMDEETTPGLSLPEKFEKVAGKVNFAVALLTPDDEGKALSESLHQPRARQNVLIEIGWFWGRLGREKILLLVKKRVEIPSDLQGIVYCPFNETPIERSENIRDFYKAHHIPVT